ncbi:MerR family transcriptional regulator [Paenibacillus thalictri]|uniref:Methyltransferase domain-containing protein n=1 Tax=Paenibacillus thalictri TaxID=2527873 RepID=A0A4Q9DG67_9BACL|nr:MerR family transcriptional regulator [Paenibacillus thalictri]TBL71190.1 methyltransferase domain-containing protein [Paenibacillus thalictri]
MKIHEVAQRLGLTPRTIRFYEEKGLLSPSKLPHSGYREFSESDVWRLASIASLREVGMRLEDIGRLLGQMEQDNPDEVRHLLELQRSAMFSQWLQLKEMIGTLDRIIEENAAAADPSRLHWGQQLHKLTDSLGELKERRSRWIDRWNFDGLPALPGSTSPDLRSHVPPEQEYERALEMAVQWVGPRSGEAGLDVGTGTGELARRCIRKGAAMVGVDQSRRMLSHCRDKLPELTTRLGNLLALPCFDAQYDFVVSSFALHHLSGDQHPLALAEMDRVLKPRGRLCIVDFMNEEDGLRTGAGTTETFGADEENPAVRERLVSILQAWGYVTIQQSVEGATHIVYAVKTNT